MKGVCLQIYTNELQKQHGKLMYEWLLERAKKAGLSGGSVFRSIAGYGRDGVLHEEHFFELAAQVPILVNFFLQRTEAEKFLKLLQAEKVNIFYSLTETEYGTLLPSSEK